MRDETNWAGIYPAALTMFDARGELDEETCAAHIDRLVREGAHGLVLGGTSGEFAGLVREERARLFALAAEAVNGRVPVIAGAGWYSTRDTVASCEDAAAAGADGVILILPYFQRPSVDEIVAHYEQVGRQATLPVMIYNNPANSAAPPLEAAHLAKLYVAGAAIAVKSTFPTVHQIHEVRAVTDEGFRTFYGSFMAPLEGLSGGAHGWISGILNVATPMAVELWEAIRATDLTRAHAAWRRIMPYKMLYTESQLGSASDLAIYRGVLRLRGLPGGHCRPPLLDLTTEQMARLEKILDHSDDLDDTSEST